jgi:hypothetical protein
MFGNGRTVFTRNILTRSLMDAKNFNQRILVLFAAVPSAGDPTSRVAPTATGTSQTTGTGTTVSELSSPQFFHHDDSGLWGSESLGLWSLFTLIVQDSLICKKANLPPKAVAIKKLGIMGWKRKIDPR